MVRAADDQFPGLGLAEPQQERRMRTAFKLLVRRVPADEPVHPERLRGHPVVPDGPKRHHQWSPPPRELRERFDRDEVDTFVPPELRAIHCFYPGLGQRLLIQAKDAADEVEL